MRAAARARTATPPMAIPTMAPVGREEEDGDIDGSEAAVVVVTGAIVGGAVAPVYVVVLEKLVEGKASGRNDCPGLNSTVAFSAYAI